MHFASLIWTFFQISYTHCNFILSIRSLDFQHRIDSFKPTHTCSLFLMRTPVIPIPGDLLIFLTHSTPKTMLSTLLKTLNHIINIFFLNFLHVSFCNESKLRHVIKVTVYFFVTYRKKGSRIQFKAFS